MTLPGRSAREPCDLSAQWREPPGSPGHPDEDARGAQGCSCPAASSRPSDSRRGRQHRLHARPRVGDMRGRTYNVLFLRAAAPSRSGAASKVIAPPSKAATTRRLSTGATSNSSGPSAACIGPSFREQPRPPTRLSESTPRCARFDENWRPITSDPSAPRGGMKSSRLLHPIGLVVTIRRCGQLGRTSRGDSQWSAATQSPPHFSLPA
jgi:hypothetical protein